jgi:dipeptidyl aminopeptidase/acylaminoacyl peptidase
MDNKTTLRAASFSLVTMLLVSPLSAQSVGLFEGHTDVGDVRMRGAATYDAEREEYRISGAGYNVWFDHDEFHFVWKRLSGDFIVRAHAQFLGQGVDPHRKLGWMVRSSLDSNATHVNAVVHGDGLTSLQMRRTVGGQTEEVRSSITGADVIQLERRANTYTMSVARFGDSFVTEQADDLVLGESVYVGLFVSSHNEDALEEAVFKNVRIIATAPDDFVPYQDYIGSNLEIMDVETGRRKVLHRSSESLQAPNWTTDGKALIYNSNGLLYRFDLQTRMPFAINTGFATQNNNDHVLSFDGQRLAISHHSAEDDETSIIYTVPVEGGIPHRVTASGPSYVHGWSLDGRFLVYTAGRGGDYDIYKIPVEGGEEIRLTSEPGLDDGPEYSPDGKYVYFNSVRSGTMQLWRMRPDGSEPEQLTDDSFNNWFPHVSPDGKRIVFLSFHSDVDPGDHPFYRHVLLRMMSADGGTPKVIAYVYGGQGTINVPSWSPDSKWIAFVSNTIQ